jgi:hypothetical protein
MNCDRGRGIIIITSGHAQRESKVGLEVFAKASSSMVRLTKVIISVVQLL